MKRLLITLGLFFCFTVSAMAEEDIDTDIAPMATNDHREALEVSGLLYELTPDQDLLRWKRPETVEELEVLLTTADGKLWRASEWEEVR